MVFKRLEHPSLHVDRRIRMAARGTQRFAELIKGSGGTLDTAGVALLIETTNKAVYTMVSRNQLLAFKQNRTWAFPVAQFDQSTRRPVDHLDLLLGAFTTDVGNDSRVIFCLSNYERTGRSPLALLAQGFSVDILSHSAATLFEHGAR